jgi:hypothetical protein
MFFPATILTYDFSKTKEINIQILIYIEALLKDDKKRMPAT